MKEKGRAQDKQEEIRFFERTGIDGADAEEWIERLKRLEEEDTSVFFDVAGLDAVTGANVLEAGCGIGMLGRRICQNGNTVIGIDITPKMVEIANSFGDENYHAIVGDLEDHDTFQDATFDLICCRMVLHHFRTTNRVMFNLSAWLKAGGRIIIFEPNGSSPIGRLSGLMANFLKVFAKQYYLDAGIGTTNETRHTAGIYVTELTRHNFRILERRYFYFHNKPKPRKLLIHSVTYLLYLMYEGAYVLLPQRLRCPDLLIIAEKC